jgi:hypothetical protein
MSNTKEKSIPKSTPSSRDVSPFTMPERRASISAPPRKDVSGSGNESAKDLIKVATELLNSAGNLKREIKEGVFKCLKGLGDKIDRLVKTNEDLKENKRQEKDEHTAESLLQIKSNLEEQNKLLEKQQTQT